MNIFKHCFEELTEKDAEVLKEYFHGFDYRGAGLYLPGQLYLPEYPLLVLGGYRQIICVWQARTV